MNITREKMNKLLAEQVPVSLPECELSGLILRGVELKRADPGYSVLVRADLQRADLERADLSHANLQEANLEGANLAGAKMDGAILTNAIMPNGKKHN